MGEEVHECHEMIMAPEGYERHGGDGPAIARIVFLEGKWWAYSGCCAEYQTVIAFCPFCGRKL